MNSILLASLVCLTTLSCRPAEDEIKLQPAVQITLKESGANYASYIFETINAEGTAIICQKSDKEAPSEETLLSKGVKVAAKSTSMSKVEYRSSNLDELCNYTAYALAYDSKGAHSSIVTVNFTTGKGVSSLYPWEETRTELPVYDNLALCYGGSPHRSPYRWNRERFATHVTYKNSAGVEKWLFDAFLAIEFVDTGKNMSLGIGYRANSADKACWESLLDYWFSADNGFAELDQAVASAIKRIGNPPTTRKVVMVLPDPIIYKVFDDTTSPTDYWGEVDGKKLDFKYAEDRLTAMKWYIDEIRARWHKAGYQNIELIGFYIVSEDLAQPGYGWSAELKHWEDIYPELSKYIHSANETLNWIPYYNAGGYQLWKDYQIDNVQMQPNLFWNDKPQYSWETFASMTKKAGISMELEMDDALIKTKESTTGKNSATHKKIFRQYMSKAKELGFYDTREFSYYMGQDALQELSKSKNSDDIEMYQEFCEFVSNHHPER